MPKPAPGEVGAEHFLDFLESDVVPTRKDSSKTPQKMACDSLEKCSDSWYVFADDSEISCSPGVQSPFFCVLGLGSHLDSDLSLVPTTVDSINWSLDDLITWKKYMLAEIPCRCNIATSRGRVGTVLDGFSYGFS